MSSSPMDSSHNSTILGSNHFRFLDLPLEVKLNIFQYFVPTPPPALAVRYADEENADTLLGIDRCTKFQTSKNLLQTCRQLNIELSPLFYQHCTFVFTDPVDFANDFLRHLPDYKIMRMRQLRWDAWLTTKTRDWLLRKVKEVLMVYCELECLSKFEIHYSGWDRDRDAVTVHEADTEWKNWDLIPGPRRNRTESLESALKATTFSDFLVFRGVGYITDSWISHHDQICYKYLGARILFLKP